MTSKEWGTRYLAYLRAHDIYLTSPVEVRADAVNLWIEEQRTAWLESDGSLGFDAWLEERFPAPEPLTAVWGADQVWGF